MFDDSTQLHGNIILQLKAQWPCDKHHGEHGEAGFCYIDPNGNHLGLNMRKLKVWAAAIVSLPSRMYRCWADRFYRLPTKPQSMFPPTQQISMAPETVGLSLCVRAGAKTKGRAHPPLLVTSRHFSQRPSSPSSPAIFSRRYHPH